MSYNYEPKIKIDVTRDVHEQLRDLKKQKDTFNDVLKRILEERKSQKEVSKLAAGFGLG